ncbi:MAG: hypothetical protein M1835_003826, partial [Candelina submexicana]
MSFTGKSSVGSLRHAFERSPRPQKPNLPALPLAPTKAGLQQREFARRTSQSLTQSAAPDSTAFLPATKSPSTIELRAKRKFSENEDDVGVNKRVLNKSKVSILEKSPWDNLLRLGKLVQGSAKLTVCSAKGTSLNLTMIKRVKGSESDRELQALQQFNHLNIITLVNAFSFD